MNFQDQRRKAYWVTYRSELRQGLNPSFLATLTIGFGVALMIVSPLILAMIYMMITGRY